MRLHGYWRSSSTWRVRIVLDEKGIEYEPVPVNLLHGSHSEPEYLARNPMGQVPALELDDGRMLTQSVAILEYLEQVHPSPPMLPAEAVERARVRAMVEIVNSGVQPLQNLAVLKALDTLGADRKQWSTRWIDKGLAVLESMASEHGPWLVGSGPTFAEACLIPQLYNARRFGMDVAQYPRLHRCEAACMERPAFQSSHPDQQPDAVVD